MTKPPKKKPGPSPKPENLLKRAYGFSLAPETINAVKAIAKRTPGRSEGHVVAEAVGLLSAQIDASAREGAAK